MHGAKAAELFDDAPADADRVDIAAPEDKWPALLAEMVDVLAATLARRGRSVDDALADAQACAIAIGQYQGGRNAYLPTGERLRKAVRDRALYLESNRGNKSAIARRENITERRLEQIRAEQRAIQVRKIQRNLFD